MTGRCYTQIPNVPDSLPDSSLWDKLVEYEKRNYVLTASITKYEQPKDYEGFFRDDGLVLGHAYSVICFKAPWTADGQEIKLVMLRNPHGESEEVADGVVVTNWRGEWCDHSYCWATHPEIAAQVGYSPLNDGLFWMCWADFCSTFDKVCVLPKSMGEERSPHAHSRRSGSPTHVTWGLQQMGDTKLQNDLRQLSFAFDPYLNFPEFLDDGTLDSRLKWEATKPGRLQSFLDLNKKTSDAGYQFLVNKVTELDLHHGLALSS